MKRTRNIMVQGTVKNPEHKLRPGMFVDVEVLLPETEGVLAIPSSVDRLRAVRRLRLRRARSRDANGKPGRKSSSSS